MHALWGCVDFVCMRVCVSGILMMTVPTSEYSFVHKHNTLFIPSFPTPLCVCVCCINHIVGTKVSLHSPIENYNLQFMDKKLIPMK